MDPDHQLYRECEIGLIRSSTPFRPVVNGVQFGKGHCREKANTPIGNIIELPKTESWIDN